jgi:hypothetical protein
MDAPPPPPAAAAATPAAFAVGEPCILNAPDYAGLPSRADVQIIGSSAGGGGGSMGDGAVSGSGSGSGRTYTIRYLGTADATQKALSGAVAGVKGTERSGIRECFLRKP